MFNLNHLFSHASPVTSTGATPIAPFGKTASDGQPAQQQPPAQDRVRAALDGVLANREKNASAQPPAQPQGQTPAADLEKVAAAAAERSRQGHLKEAHDMGRAMADGFMSQVAVYEKVAAEHAAAQGGGDGATEAERQAAYTKTAAEMEELVQITGANHWLYGQAAVEALAS